MIKLTQEQYEKLIDYLIYVEHGIFPMLEYFFKNVLKIDAPFEEIKKYLVDKELVIFDNTRRLWYANITK